MTYLVTFQHATLGDKVIPEIAPKTVYSSAVTLMGGVHNKYPDDFTITLADKSGAIWAHCFLRKEECASLGVVLSAFGAGKPQQVDTQSLISSLRRLLDVTRAREPGAPDHLQVSDAEYNAVLLGTELILAQCKGEN